MERDKLFDDVIAGIDDFNSHAHVERDSYLNGENAEEQKISTHTLTWSVTPS